MAESLFDIFGDILKQTNNVVRQPLSNVENIGVSKKSSGPLKPQEPFKPIKETKKSFLNNAGTKLTVSEAATPRRNALASRPHNVQTTASPATFFVPDDLTFTKPLYRYDNFHSDVLDHLPLWEPAPWPDSPEHKVSTPEMTHSMEHDDSYTDDFFSDDLSDISITAEDLGLPELY